MNRYHMKRKEKEIAEAAEMRRAVAEARFTQVALSMGGEPYIVTMNHGYDEQRGVLYFHCALEGKKIDFIGENGRACATVVEDHGYKHGECDHAYRSVVMNGKIEIVEDLAEKKHGMKVLLDHQEKEPGPIEKRTLPDDEAYDRVGVLKFTIETMTGKQGS